MELPKPVFENRTGKHLDRGVLLMRVWTRTVVSKCFEIQGSSSGTPGGSYYLIHKYFQSF